MTRPSDVREAVLATAREMYAKGLVEGTSGNVSGRMPDGSVCVTPSSIPYASMGLEDLVILDPDGHVLDGSRSPTSEKDLHLACYRAFAEVGGVIHSHATYASMFACARQPVPAVNQKDRQVVVLVRSRDFEFAASANGPLIGVKGRHQPWLGAV